MFGYIGLSVYGCWDSGDTVQPSTEWWLIHESMHRIQQVKTGGENNEILSLHNTITI